jgi:hypothetical protein
MKPDRFNQPEYQSPGTANARVSSILNSRSYHDRWKPNLLKDRELSPLVLRAAIENRYVINFDIRLRAAEEQIPREDE